MNFKSTQSEVTQGLLLQDFVEWYNFPAGLTTPNGVAVGPDQKIWLADTRQVIIFSALILKLKNLQNMLHLYLRLILMVMHLES